MTKATTTTPPAQQAPATEQSGTPAPPEAAPLPPEKGGPTLGDALQQTRQQAPAGEAEQTPPEGERSPQVVALEAKLAEAQAKIDAAEREKMSENERKEADRKAAEERAAKAESELARTRAAIKHGLPEDALEFLPTGGTPDEIDAAAQKLKGMLSTPAGGGGSSTPPSFDGGNRGTAGPTVTSMNDAIRQRAGRG